MSESFKTISIVAAEVGEERNMRPSLQGLADRTAVHAVEISIDALASTLSDELSKLREVIRRANEDPSALPKLSTVSVSFGIDASGKVSLCSLADASLTGRATISLEFKL